jgi:ribosomal protein S15P/S13E
MQEYDRPLVSFFDEPLEAEALGKWVEHQGRTVFVPNFPKWLQPGNKPKGQNFHYKDGGKWAPGEWGFNQNIYDRIAVVKENKRILDYYRERGEEPPPWSTVHLPGVPWRPSDEGYDQEAHEISLEAREGKARAIKEAIGVVKSKREEVEKWLFDTKRGGLQPEDNEMVDILRALAKEFHGHFELIANIREKYPYYELSGKARSEMKEKMKKDIHSRKIHALPQFFTRWSGYMEKIKSATDALGTRNFLGTEFPAPDEKGNLYVHVIMAVIGTTRQQIMRLLAVRNRDRKDGLGDTFVPFYVFLEDLIARINCLTSHVKVGSKYKRLGSSRARYPDSTQLESWYDKHSPGCFFINNVT